MYVTSRLCELELGTYGLVPGSLNTRKSRKFCPLDTRSSHEMASFRHPHATTGPRQLQIHSSSQDPHWPLCPQDMPSSLPTCRPLPALAPHTDPGRRCTFQLTGLAERRLECKQKIAAVVAAIAYVDSTECPRIPPSPAAIFTWRGRPHALRCISLSKRSGDLGVHRTLQTRRCAHDDQPVDSRFRTRAGTSETWSRNEAGMFCRIKGISRRRFALPTDRLRGSRGVPSGWTTRSWTAISVSVLSTASAHSAPRVAVFRPPVAAWRNPEASAEAGATRPMLGKGVRISGCRRPRPMSSTSSTVERTRVLLLAPAQLGPAGTGKVRAGAAGMGGRRKGGSCL